MDKPAKWVQAVISWYCMVVDASSCLRTGYAGIKFMYLEDSGRVKLLVMISAVNGSGGYLLGKGQ